MGHDETAVPPLLPVQPRSDQEPGSLRPKAFVLTAVILVIATVLAGCSDDADRSDQAVSTVQEQTATTQEQAVANQVIATIPLSGTPTFNHFLGIAATGTATWLFNLDGSVSRIDPATNELTATIPVGDEGTAGTATETAVWVATVDHASTVGFAPTVGHHIARIDPVTDEVTTRVAFDGVPTGVAATETAVWVTDAADSVSRIDPTTNEVIATIPINGDIPIGGGSGAVAATDTAVWVPTYNDDGATVSRIDPATNEVTATIPVGSAVQGVAATDEAAWVSTAEESGIGDVLRIDAATNEVTARISPSGQNLGAIAATDTAVWVYSFGQLVRIDPATNEIAAEVDGGHGLLAATDTAVWVDSYDGDDYKVLRIQP